MMFPILLALVVQAPDPAAKAASLAPIVSEDIAAVAHLDLARLDLAALSGQVLGKLSDQPEIAGPIKMASAWTDALKKAGARDVYLLVDPGDVPNLPLIAVPLPPGGDPGAIGRVFTAGTPGMPAIWPASETIRGLVVAGPPATLARLRAAAPVARPDLAAALVAGGDAPIFVALLPTTAQRRVVEEAMPNLPPIVGGGPVTTLTRGMSWATLTLTAGPRPALTALIQARDAPAAKALETPIQQGLGFLTQAVGPGPLGDAVGKLRPETTGDRITVAADLKEASALLAEPVAQAREAARRSRCVNNLKHIALAMHNYHAEHNTFPPAYSVAKDGKPLLSWRVLILPLVEEKTLFDKFHLDEPWDSPHNLALVPLMPKLYACPDADAALAVQGKTSYLTPRGPGTIFPGGKAIAMQNILDGTSNTILVVDANDAAAVVWTRPDDWDVDDVLKFPILFGHHPQGTNITFADGAVKLLKETINPRVWKALLTRDGGEVVSGNEF